LVSAFFHLVDRTRSPEGWRYNAPNVRPLHSDSGEPSESMREMIRQMLDRKQS
jgi:hypothetical protein